jgi:hypothetical protein
MIITRLFLLFGTFGLSSCELVWNSSDDISPRFAPLRASAEPNPAEDAIVGMWHRRGEAGFEQTSISLLFRRNGEGMIKELTSIGPHGKIHATVTMGGVVGDKSPVSFTYRYLGNGAWLDSLGCTYWLSNGHLLRQAKGRGVANNVEIEGHIKDVFDRVE